MGFLRKQGKRWYCVFDIPTENGKRKQKWVAAYQDKPRSDKLLTNLVNEVNKGTYIEPSEEHLRDFLKTWLQTKKGSIRKATFNQYHYFVRDYIAPKLGKHKLSQLKTKHIKAFYNDLRETSGLSQGSLFRLHITLKNALNSAVEDEAIAKNPALFNDAPKRPKKELQFWDEKTAWQFLEYAEGERTYIAFYLAIMTGMRQGEILGLKWSDIDLERKIITIHRTLSHDGSQFQEPKTNSSKRSIRIYDKTIEQLRKHYIRMKEERLRAGDIYQDTGLVVCTRLGTSLSPRNLNRIWYRLRKKANVPEIRFHDLRHTHVAIAIKDGQQLPEIAERIGHSSLQQIDETYGHLLPGIQETAAARFEDHFYAQKEIEQNR